MSATYVMLHGFTGGPASFDDLVRLLPADARVVRPTICGHGPSPARADGWDDEMDRLLGLLEAEDVTDAHLVGYSMGGRVGWGLLQRSDRFTRATLIGAHPGLEDAAKRARRRVDDTRWIRLLEEEGLAAFIERWEALPLWRSQLTLEPARLLRQRAVREAHDPGALASTLRAIGLGEMPPTDPARVRVPVSLVVGVNDTRHRAIAERFAPRLADARLHLVARAGHNVLLERADALAETILEARP